MIKNRENYQKISEPVEQKNGKEQALFLEKNKKIELFRKDAMNLENVFRITLA